MGFVAAESTFVPFLSVERAVSSNKQHMHSHTVFVSDAWVQVENPLPYLKFGISVCFIAARGYQLESEINGEFPFSSVLKTRCAIGRYV